MASSPTRWLVLLSVVPAGVLALVWTAGHHSYFYAEPIVRTVDGVSLLETPPAIGHRINVVYSYGLLLIGTGLIVGETVTNNLNAFDSSRVRNRGRYRCRLGIVMTMVTELCRVLSVNAEATTCSISVPDQGDPK